MAKRSRNLPSYSIAFVRRRQGTSSMEKQRHVCVIDWFGVNYDGIMPTILLACDENGLVSFRSRRQIHPIIWNRIQRDGLISFFEGREFSSSDPVTL
jgi:hypothetical protein